MAPNIKTLAKLYLEGKPVELSDQSTSQLCDWLMGEFQQLPINPMFSNYMRYRTAAEMCADIAQDQLWVSADSYDSKIYPNPFYGFAFLAVHDYYHCVSGSDFSLEGEIKAYRTLANRVPSLEIQKIIYSEIVLKSSADIYLNHSPEPKLVFP
ncbi:hypothetical protein VB735_25535 [Halotia wernerae UHCC 0503]|nr:hypothetical protein [Halotia wernerae UHCC 0503]